MTSYQYESFAVDYLNANITTHNVRVKVVCPFHDDHSPSMSFHLDLGYFKCFTCKARGNITRVAQQVGLTIIGDDYIEELDNFEDEVRAFSRSVDDMLNPPVTENSVLPESWLARFSRATTNYWHGRGLTDRTIARWQLGFDRMANHATLPLRDLNGNLIGVIRRQLDEDAKPKYLNPKGYQKRSSFYGASLVHPNPRSGHTVLVEGPVDVLKVSQAGYNTLGLLGGDFSPDQVPVLHKLGVTSLVLFYDADEAGYNIAKSTYYECRKDFDLYVATPKHNYPNDPGGMSSAQIQKSVSEAVPLRSF